MKRLYAIGMAVTIVVLAGCGGGSKASSEPPAKADTVTQAPTTTARAQDWFDQMRAQGFVPADAREVRVDGVKVLVSDAERFFLVEDCAVSTRLSAEGGQFGPTGSWDDGTAQAGYGSACNES